jgi:hypothetical protein
MLAQTASTRLLAQTMPRLTGVYYNTKRRERREGTKRRGLARALAAAALTRLLRGSEASLSTSVALSLSSRTRAAGETLAAVRTMTVAAKSAGSAHLLLPAVAAELAIAGVAAIA